MTEAAIFAGIGLALLLLLLWVARIRVNSPGATESELRWAVEDLFPRHCQRFPQVRQALSQTDEYFLQRRASPRVQRQARAVRQEVARQYLAGLKEDFERLERLGRTVSALSPEVSRAQETERLWLGLRFRFLHGFVRLRLAEGSVSVPQVSRLTELVGGLAAQTERAMTLLEEASLESLRPNLTS